MREPLVTISEELISGTCGRVQSEIPAEKQERDALLGRIRDYCAAGNLIPPLSSAELQEHAHRFADGYPAAREFPKYAAVLLNNEVWRRTLAGVPSDRRLLLLPQCLRNRRQCQAPLDELGLLCRCCGGCAIGDLKAEAQRLGYVVLVAEGSAVVTSLIQSGRIEAVIGVSCLSVLERVFPYMEAAAIPALAIPLLHDGCQDSSVDLDWVWDAVHLTSDDNSGALKLEELRRGVESWFAPAAMESLLGSPASQTERIARDWLGRSGKRWRPFLAACAYQALRQSPVAEPIPQDFQLVAMAVECFHKASLVHDDIEDNDAMRYGEKTLHEQYGVPIALNVGDFLLGEGYRLIAMCQAAPGRKAQMLRVAAEGHRNLSIGQGEELCWVRQSSVLPPGKVLEIFRSKTAPAFEVALHLGALYAGAENGVLEALSRFSEALGIAYQIRDDLNDFTSPGGDGDLRALRPSVLLSIAHQQAQGPDQAALHDLWCRRTSLEQSQRQMEATLSRLEVVPRVRRLLDSYKQQAIRSLCSLDSASLKIILRRVICRIFDDMEPLVCCREYKTGNDESGLAGGVAAR